MRTSIQMAIFGFLLLSLNAIAELPKDPQFYRDFTLKIRQEGKFNLAMPNGDQPITYKIEFGSPIYETPIVSDTGSGVDENIVYRNFWDRIWLKDTSYLELSGQKIPLTCIFVSGQDNRDSGSDSPLFPKILMKIYFVANDYSCVGPINPNWPSNGGKKEAWDTYLYYEVRDPTVMMPVEAKIRYRWNEFHLVAK